jgi:hypothetical protein
MNPGSNQQALWQKNKVSKIGTFRLPKDFAEFWSVTNNKGKWKKYFREHPLFIFVTCFIVGEKVQVLERLRNILFKISQLY